jgi:2-hydroxychromene-2-carboxylate isomerase
MFSQRSAARQSYRQLELARWSKRLGVPIILEPQHYPVDRGPSSRLLISTANLGKDALGLSHVILRAIWAEDQDISDWSTLTKLACQHGLDGNLLVEAAQHEGIEAQYRENTSRAIKAQVFGSPTFIVDGERFWGQDRLDFLADRILRC